MKEARVKILVVENDADQLRWLKESLSDAGWL